MRHAVGPHRRGCFVAVVVSYLFIFLFKLHNLESTSSSLLRRESRARWEVTGVDGEERKEAQMWLLMRSHYLLPYHPDYHQYPP